MAWWVYWRAALGARAAASSLNWPRPVWVSEVKMPRTLSPVLAERAPPARAPPALPPVGGRTLTDLAVPRTRSAAPWLVAIGWYPFRVSHYTPIWRRPRRQTTCTVHSCSSFRPSQIYDQPPCLSKGPRNQWYQGRVMSVFSRSCGDAPPPPGGCARGGGQWAGTHGRPRSVPARRVEEDNGTR